MRTTASRAEAATEAPLSRVRALRLHGARDLRLHDEPLAPPGPGEAVVRMTAIGLCGSDLHWYEDGRIGDVAVAEPLVLGHELAGVIESGPRAGERVAIDPANTCGRCEPCLAGDENLCAEQRFAGHPPTDGGLRSHLVWPERLLQPVPDSIGDAEASLLETLGVALHAVDLGHVRSETTAGVWGCGPVGLLIVQALRDLGLTVFALDPLPHRLAAARALGASTAERPVDVAFEAAGDDGAVEAAIRAVRPGARIVLVGIPGDDRTSFPAGLARRKGLTFSVSRRMNSHDLTHAIELAGAGRVDLAALVTERFSLEQAPAAFEALASRRGLKVVVQP